MQALDSATYDSVAEFIASLSSRPIRNSANLNGFQKWEIGSEGYGASWFGAGCKHAPDVKRLVSSGWREGQDAVAAMIDKTRGLEAAPRDTRRRLVRCELGDSLDIHAVYRGQLDTAWTRAKRQSGRGPQRVDILANMICSGGESPAVLQWRGVCAIALADKLERAGYMVRIVVGFGGPTSRGAQAVSCRITVKPHDMPIDAATCASVTLPGFFRALGHQWVTVHAPGPCDSGSMYVKGCREESGEIVLSHDVRDERTALARVEQELARIDAELGAAA